MPAITLLENALRLIFPNACCACGQEIFNSRLQICHTCYQQLPTTGFEHLRVNPVYQMFTGRIPVEYGISWLYFEKKGPVQHIIHAIKYHGNQRLGYQVGQLMARSLLKCGWAADVEALVPMPLNIGKLRQRGFNQADVLARGMADVLNIPVIPVAVIRSKYTQTQTRKSRIERWLNVEDVFELSNPKTLQHKHVLLVDDIITTGATMEACGQVLLQIEGLRLSVMSYAYAHRL